MKKRLLLILISVFVLIMSASGCGSKDDDTAAESSSSGIPVDILKSIADDATSHQEEYQMISDLKISYQTILDGVLDDESGYYVYDITGDKKPELIVGPGMMTVYSYSNGDIITVGTMYANAIYLSGQYGLISQYLNGENDELRLYTFDGENLNEQVVLHTETRDEFNTLSVTYLKDAKPLKRYNIPDRSVFD